MDMVSDNAKIEIVKISNELKIIMAPLFKKHMNDIMSGNFSNGMMKDWANDDIKLLRWRDETRKTDFENTLTTDKYIKNQDYFNRGIVMIAFVKSGVELAFDTMVESGIIEESAYYESLHELPLIANLISRKKLYEMNSIISDTAEYGCYLFSNEAKPLLKNYIHNLNPKLFAEKFEQSNPITVDMKIIF
jgi:ketol-acid reductoisomerase